MQKQTFRGETIGLRAHSSEMVEFGPKSMSFDFEFRVFVLLLLREDCPEVHFFFF